jgi:hypothetical protein
METLIKHHYCEALGIETGLLMNLVLKAYNLKDSSIPEHRISKENE